MEYNKEMKIWKQLNKMKGNEDVTFSSTAT